MKVLLISANKLSAPYFVYPLSLDYVAGALKDKHETHILDMNNFKKNEDISAEVLKFKPDVIGLSLRNIDNTDTTNVKAFLKEYKDIVDILKKESDVPLVLGGCGFTIFPEDIIEELGADFGIIGEGERFPLLLDAIEKKNIPDNIPGVIKKGGRGIIPEPYCDELNRDFSPGREHVEFYVRRGGMLNLQSKRGCTFKCIYCTYPHIEGNKLRLFPPEEVAETAIKLQEAGAKYFFITDSAFNCNYEHSLKVAEAFIEAGIKIPWGAFFAPTSPPEDYFATLKKAGLSHVEFGTESLSNRMLSAYRKPFNVEGVLHAHQKAVEAGLYIAHYFMLGGPGENTDTLNETLVNIEKISKAAFFFFCGVRIYPYTALYDIALSEGQISKSQNLLEPVFYQSAEITSEEIIDIVQKSSRDRSNWFVGSGGKEIEEITRKMYRRKHTGPLWEMAIT